MTEPWSLYPADLLKTFPICGFPCSWRVTQHMFWPTSLISPTTAYICPSSMETILTLAFCSTNILTCCLSRGREGTCTSLMLEFMMSTRLSFLWHFVSYLKFYISFTHKFQQQIVILKLYQEENCANTQLKKFPS